jgi:LysM repeat protein
MGRSRLAWLFVLLTLAGVLGHSVVLAQENTYVIQPGDSLYRIAVRYGLTVSQLAQANNISNTWQIYAGQTLIIPNPDGTVPGTAAESIVAYEGGTPLYHTVRRGDNLASIARRYSLTADQLAEMNNIVNPNLIYAGQQLLVGMQMGTETVVPAAVASAAELVAAPVAEQFTGGETQLVERRHVVQPGEYLSQIAVRYGVPWTAIAQANNIYNPDTVYAGQSLIIPGAAQTISADGQVMVTYGLDYVPAAPPAPTGIGREILVDLSDSRVYAYENGILVRNVIASMGRPNTPTVQGNFTVQRKYVSQAMSGPGYYLPDVPYILYFYQGYALHGTYWHNNFGQPMSNGCVNLQTHEAEWFFNWADVGTPVRVQA